MSAYLDAKRAVVNALRDTCENGRPAADDEVVREDFDWYQERLAEAGWTLTQTPRKPWALVRVDGLTAREHDCLTAYVDKGTIKGAAAALGLAPQTVKNHLYAARDRAGAHSTLDLLYRLMVGDLEVRDEVPD